MRCSSCALQEKVRVCVVTVFEGTVVVEDGLVVPPLVVVLITVDVGMLGVVTERYTKRQPITAITAHKDRITVNNFLLSLCFITLAFRKTRIKKHTHLLYRKPCVCQSISAKKYLFYKKFTGEGCFLGVRGVYCFGKEVIGL